MRVKRYVVDTLPDALHKIRQELGKDAVILNTKQLKVGGFLGLFSKKKIEVIAAIDNDRQGTKQQRTEHAALRNAQAEVRMPQSVTSNAYAAKLYRHTSGHGESPNNPTLRPASPPDIAVEPRVNAAAEVPDQKDGQVDNPIEQFKRAAAKTIQEAASRPVAAPHAASNDAAHASKEEQQELLSEIREMKTLIAKLTIEANVEANAANTADPFHTIEERLAEQEVLPSLIHNLRALAAEQGAAGGGTELDEAAARSLIKSQLRKILEQAPISGIQERSRIVRFVGPTGVGKTTTIAKLAAEQVLKHHKKIGFITSDTYRIAAIDQLKTYGSILNVPVEVVFSPDEMQAAFTKLSDRDLIFMDTAGRNYREESSISELERLLDDDHLSETYLVLSLAAKYSDIREIVGNFTRFKIDKVLWTKLDETTSYGAILNLQSEFALPMSYITNGQNVPDDIAVLEPNMIADLLLGEDAHE